MGLAEAWLKLHTALPRREVAPIKTAWSGLLESLCKEELKTQIPRQALMENVKK